MLWLTRLGVASKAGLLFPIIANYFIKCDKKQE